MNNDPLPPHVTSRPPRQKAVGGGRWAQARLKRGPSETQPHRPELRSWCVHSQTQMPRHSSCRLALREWGWGVGSAAKYLVDFNDATSEWNREGEKPPFKALTHKDKNHIARKKETNLKCNTWIRLLTRLSQDPFPTPQPPLTSFFRTGVGQRKIHLFLGVRRPPHQKEIAGAQAAQRPESSQIGCRWLIYTRK